MRILITAGGTREYLDPVRFISNASSGKTGYAFAQAAKAAGHKVTLISAADLQPPVGVEFVGVDTAAQMFSAVKRFFGKCDCLIMAAAVSDYRPSKRRKTKIAGGRESLSLLLKRTPDILAWAGRHKAPDQVLVGFALEDKNLRSNAERKMRQKNLDMIVANTPAAVGADEAEVHIKVAGQSWEKLATIGKTALARRIIKTIEGLTG